MAFHSRRLPEDPGMDANPVPVLHLVAKQTHRCQLGHRWVFRSEFAELPPLGNGDVVDVHDPRKRFIGRGLYSASSQIAVRLFSTTPTTMDADFWRERLRTAIAHRDQAMAGRPCRRLVGSEGDLLPGLIVDQYHDRLVVQATTVGIDQRLSLLVALLRELLAPTQVVERDDLPVRALEGLPQRAGVIHGPTGTRLIARIGKLDVAMDLLDPHKTGSYLDQQLNHEAMERWTRPGDRVADVCCHLGGFALHGLLAGAASAIGIDQSAASIAGANATATAAGVADRFQGIEADAFDWLKVQEAAKERYDVIVLDPPSFTRNRAGVEAALRGYRDLHRRAARLLNPGGRLITFSCSHHIDRAAYLQNAVEAAAEAHRTLRLDEHLGAAPDHPVIPAIPESEYLKGYVLTAIE